MFVELLSLKRSLSCDTTVCLKFITTSLSSSFIFKCFSITYEISGLSIDTGECVLAQKMVVTTCNGFIRLPEFPFSVQSPTVSFNFFAITTFVVLRSAKTFVAATTTLY